MWEIPLQRGGETSLSQQIFLFLRAHILSGALAPGESLPSSRVFASALSVSRNTVVEAYDRLWSEGFILRSQGAPTRVAQGVCLPAARTADAPLRQEVSLPPIWWDWKTGQPDLSAFPWKVWNRMLQEASGNLCASSFAYGGPKGYEPLCEEISGWLLRSRGLSAAPEDIFITAGATQAIHLLVGLTYREGTVFGLENPAHPGIRAVLHDRGIPLLRMPVDRQGAVVSALEGAAVSSVYVTPSHQFPLGAILPADRRATLLRLARAQGMAIIEDDYDSEFRFQGPPISPLRALDDEHVAYVGTFSKSVFPALRLGFAVLPKALQSRWAHARQYLDVQSPTLEQAALAEFLRTRRLDRHVQRMRRLYGVKRALLLQAVDSVFGNQVCPWGDASGLHVALQFPGRSFDEAFLLRCRKAGLRLSLLAEAEEVPPEHRDKLLIGYGHWQPERIREGIDALARALQSEGGR